MRLSQRNSKMLKGLAIIFMIFHHLYAYPSWWKFEYDLPVCELISIEKLAVLGETMKICIPIYAFLSGYGLYCSFSKEFREALYKKIGKKILSILVNYWLVLFPVSFIVFINNGFLYDYKVVLSNLFGFGKLIMPFAWYIGFYTVILVVFPCIYYVISRVNNSHRCFLVGIVYVVICKVSYYCLSRVFLIQTPEIVCQFFMYSPYIVLGSIFASVNLRVPVPKLGKHFHICISAIMLSMCLIIKIAIKGSNVLDIVIVPIFVYSFVNLTAFLNSNWINSFFMLLGEHSFNLWMLHGICFIWTFPYIEEIQTIVYFPKSIVLILIWYILLLLPFSYLVQYIYNQLWKALRLNKI